MEQKPKEKRTSKKLRTRPCILGLDPGMSGGIVVIDDRGCVLEAHKMPTYSRIVSRSRRNYYDSHELGKLLRELKGKYKLVSAAVERVAASPQMGVSSAFSFGHGYGIARGALDALEIRVINVEPTVWKRRFELGGSDKEDSVAKANEILTWPEPVKKDGIAEAALIGWYILNEVEPW